LALARDGERFLGTRVSFFDNGSVRLISFVPEVTKTNAETARNALRFAQRRIRRPLTC